NQLGEIHLVRLLEHDDYAFRLWAARLLADHGPASTGAAQALAGQAARETDVRVKAQIAATALRLAPADGLAVVARLLETSQDTDDLFLPLLAWWAVERHADEAAGHLDAMLATRGPLTDEFL